jgi:HK97 family phage prohead protease
MKQPKISRAMLENRKIECEFSIKSLGVDGRFAGYASVFNLVDRQRDVLLRGAFAETLKGRMREIKFLWQHNMAEPIGIFTDIFEDERGLYVEGRLLLEVARASEAYALLKAGAIGGLSIGYSPLRYTIDPDTGVRLLSQVELWEVSLVTFPANQAATVTVLKQFSPTNDAEWQSARRSGKLIELSDALDRAILALTK